MAKKSVSFHKNLENTVVVKRITKRPSDRCDFWYTAGEIMRARQEHRLCDSQELLARRQRCVRAVLARQEQQKDDSFSSLGSLGPSSLAKVSQSYSKIDRYRAQKQALDTARSLGQPLKKERMEVAKVVMGTFQGSVSVFRGALQSQQSFRLSRIGLSQICVLAIPLRKQTLFTQALGKPAMNM
jgi:hypothetical protein